MPRKAKKPKDLSKITANGSRLKELSDLGPLTREELAEWKYQRLLLGHQSESSTVLLDPATWEPRRNPPPSTSELIKALGRATAFLPAEPPRTGTWVDLMAEYYQLYHRRTHLGLVQALHQAVKAGDLDAALSSMWQLTWGISKTHAAASAARAAKAARDDRNRQSGKHDGKELRELEWKEARDDQLVMKYRDIRGQFRSDTAAYREVAASFQGISFHTVKRALERRIPT
jgi:hypothetical protein